MSIKAVFLDLSGVLYDGAELIQDAREAILTLRQSGIVLRFVTNTATQNEKQIRDKLRKMGITTHSEELFTAPIAAKEYINQHKLRPFCLVHPSIQYLFNNVTSDQANCVLLGDARELFDYDHLNQAFQLCMNGAQLLAIAKNRYFKEDQTLNLDSGAFVTALEWATNQESIVFGKPDKAFFQQVVASTPFLPKECLMVGDDIDGDVMGAINSNLEAVLVQTGKFQAEDLAKLPQSAKTVSSIVNVPELLGI